MTCKSLGHRGKKRFHQQWDFRLPNEYACQEIDSENEVPERRKDRGQLQAGLQSTKPLEMHPNITCRPNRSNKLRNHVNCCHRHDCQLTQYILTTTPRRGHSLNIYSNSRPIQDCSPTSTASPGRGEASWKPQEEEARKNFRSNGKMRIRRPKNGNEPELIPGSATKVTRGTGFCSTMEQ